MFSVYSHASNILRHVASSLKRTSPGTPCYISRLPPDVLLDIIFPLLLVEELCRLRQVNKAFYLLSHEGCIWRRYMKDMNVPLPQLRPTFRYRHESSDFDIERMVTQACAVDKAWRQGFPKVKTDLILTAFYQVIDLKLLPGGKFLIASVRDRSNYRFYIMLFALDLRQGSGARALARMPTDHKAYDLQAKYLPYNGNPGIMISFITRRFQNGATVPEDVSDYSHRTTVDPIAPFIHKIQCMHVRLDTLEQLLDPEAKVVVPSEQYKQIISRLPKPFQEVAVYENIDLEIHCSSLSELNKAPVLLMAVGNAGVGIINLPSRGWANFTCKDHVDYPDVPHRIRAIRHYPDQLEVLIIRSVCENPGPDYNDAHIFETYKIPELLAPTHIDSTENFVFKSHPYLHDFSISDPGTLPLKRMGEDHPDIRHTEICPPTIWVFAQNKSPPGVVYWNIRPNLKFRATSDAPKEFAYGLDVEGPFSHTSAPYAECVLPGSERCLLYVYGRDRKDPQKLIRLRRLMPQVHFEEYPTPIVNPATSKPLLHQRAFTDIDIDAPLDHDFIRDMNAQGGMSAMTWDESTCRICLSSENDDSIRILDFAYVYDPRRTNAFGWRQRMDSGQDLW
ncbi:hypothetical protein B0H34DRAFT_792224 [Crassisporium funariophilum]|nr:hypothetical protein B0H34DRAFT_792224 [Crassisporium funariophilum]